MGIFAGVQIVEFRLYADPIKPEVSAYIVHLPITVLEAVFDQDTGETLAEIISALKQSITKDNMTASEDPTENDYVGYSAGSKWFNHTNGILWVCKNINKSNDTPSAIWTKSAIGYGY